MLHQLSLAAFAAIALTAAASSAHAGRGGCGAWQCGLNGAKLTGIADQTSDESERFEWRGGCGDWSCGLNGSSYQGVQMDGLMLEKGVGSGRHAVTAVILPNGEVVDLH